MPLGRSCPVIRYRFPPVTVPVAWPIPPAGHASVALCIWPSLTVIVFMVTGTAPWSIVTPYVVPEPWTRGLAKLDGTVLAGVAPERLAKPGTGMSTTFGSPKPGPKNGCPAAGAKRLSICVELRRSSGRCRLRARRRKSVHTTAAARGLVWWETPVCCLCSVVRD